MNRKIVLLSVFSILLLCSIVAIYSKSRSIELEEQSPSHKTIYVDSRNDGYEDGKFNHPWSTIQEAMAEVAQYIPDMEITVNVSCWGDGFGQHPPSPSPYVEPTINITRPLNLYGNGISILDPRTSGIAIHISSACNVSGFTILQARLGNHEAIHVIGVYDSTNIYGNYMDENDYGVMLVDCANISITENIMVKNKYGIYMHEDVQTCEVINNTVDGQAQYMEYSEGIYLSNAKDIIISRNNIKYNNFGIRMSDVRESIISGNIIQHCPTGIDAYSSAFNYIEDNSVYVGSYGMYIVQSQNSTLRNNDLRNLRDEGIYVKASHRINITSNFIYRCSSGIQLNEETNGTITRANTISSCLVSGIDAKKNTFDNVIYHNDFFDNRAQAREKGNNIWDNGPLEGGNYWSDYEGEDKDDDGFGETPYIINDNHDNHPLIVPRGPIPVFWEAKRHDCSIVGNLTVSRFSIDASKFFVFSITGHGYCNLTVPRGLLQGVFTVLVDDNPRASILTWNETHMSIHFIHLSQGSHNVKITCMLLVITIRSPDLDGDGDVDIADVTKVAVFYGKPQNEWAPED